MLDIASASVTNPVTVSVPSDNEPKLTAPLNVPVVPETLPVCVPALSPVKLPVTLPVSPPTKAVDVIASATEIELNKKRLVQGFQLSGTGIIIHVVEHYSYHVGQIALITKLFTNEDLGFYANLDLNITNDI